MLVVVLVGGANCRLSCLPFRLLALLGVDDLVVLVYAAWLQYLPMKIITEDVSVVEVAEESPPSHSRFFEYQSCALLR